MSINALNYQQSDNINIEMGGSKVIEEFTALPDIMTLKQCQKALQIGRNSMLEMVNSGELDAFKLKGSWRIRKKSLIEFVERF